MWSTAGHCESEPLVLVYSHNIPQYSVTWCARSCTVSARVSEVHFSEWGSRIQFKESDSGFLYVDQDASAVHEFIQSSIVNFLNSVENIPVTSERINLAAELEHCDLRPFLNKNISLKTIKSTQTTRFCITLQFLANFPWTHYIMQCECNTIIKLFNIQ